MNIDYYITEYPYECEISESTLSYDAINVETDNVEVLYRGVCDIQQGGHKQTNGHIDCSYVMYIPLKTRVREGDIVKANYGGETISGVVLGVFLSVIGGSIIYF